MGKASRPLILPSKQNLIDLNRLHIQKTGGRFVPPNNILHEASLDWVLDTLQHPILFGVDQYPSLIEKAALLSWTIIDGHIFYDACKRTGISALDILLRSNDYELRGTDDELVELAIKIAEGSERRSITREGLSIWIKSKLERKSTR